MNRKMITITIGLFLSASSVIAYNNQMNNEIIPAEKVKPINRDINYVNASPMVQKHNKTNNAGNETIAQDKIKKPFKDNKELFIELGGTISSSNEVVISTKMPGFITEMNVNEGDLVEKGQTLYEIDDSDIQSKIAQVDLMRQNYKADLLEVERNLARYKRLLEKDMVAKYEVENLELAATKLENAIALFDKQIDEIKSHQKYLILKSPINGNVVKKMVKKGEMAMPGMPGLMLTDLDNLEVLVDVNEKDMTSFQKIKKLKKEVNIEIPAFQTEAKGLVKTIIPSSNPMTHSFKVKISIQNNEKTLYPGMYAVVKIKCNCKK